MKPNDVPCMNDEQTQIGIKLCDAVKSRPCLYDPVSPGYQMKKAVDAAWKLIAKECGDRASNCRFRWKTIRSSFTRSFRKSGLNSQYYLYDHLHFLVPFMSLTDRNDESTGQVDEIDLTQTDKEDVASLTSEIVCNDSDTTKSAEETFKGNGQQENPAEPDEQDCFIIPQHDAPPPQPDGNSEGRPSRTRKLPKRAHEPEPDPSPERQIEKRPRRIMERRKSVGGLILREYMQKHNLTDETTEPEIPQPIATPKFENPIDITQYKNELNTANRVRSNTAEVGVFAKPLMKDNSTVTERVWSSVEKAIQCEEGPRTLDDEFLETLRPRIKGMNFRQKINFKQRVYLALMDVLDDAKNFPNEDAVVELPVPLAKHFELATSGELRLMRELVSLVQAAKVSSEVVNATNNVLVLPTSTTTPPPQSDEEIYAQIVEESTDHNVAGTSKDRNTNSPNKLLSTKSTDSLGIPRHILQRAVQVTGNTGGTLLAQNGEKRRVYRIFPKTGVLPPQVIAEKMASQTTTTTSSTAGTLYVTPAKTGPKAGIGSRRLGGSLSPLNATPTPLNVNAIQYPKIIKTPTTTSMPSPMLPPNTTKSPTLTNGHTSSATPPKISINSQVPSGNIFRRRYSICGPSPAASSPVLQQRIIPLSSSKTFTPPLSQMQQPHHPKIQILPQLPKMQTQQQQSKMPMQTAQPKILLQQQLKMKQQHQLKMQQQLQQHQQSKQPQMQQPLTQPQSQQQRAIKQIFNPILSPPTSASPSPFQISKPVSLNTVPQSPNNIKTFLSSATSPTSSNDILEELPDANETSNDIPVLETAGTIAADSFGYEFPKPYIKMELEE